MKHLPTAFVMNWGTIDNYNLYIVATIPMKNRTYFFKKSFCYFVVLVCWQSGNPQLTFGFRHLYELIIDQLFEKCGTCIKKQRVDSFTIEREIYTTLTAYDFDIRTDIATWALFGMPYYVVIYVIANDRLSKV